MARLLVAAIVLLVPIRVLAGELCFGPSTIDPSQANVSVTCDPQFPALVENDWRGFSTSGVPCGSGALCSPGGASYGWTISASSADPFVNTGNVEGIDDVYLWLACSVGIDPAGASAAAFDIVPSGLTVLGYEDAGDNVHIGTATQLVIGIPGCPTPPTLIGVITVQSDPISVERSSWGSTKALYR